MSDVVLYGATGYTGRLIAAELRRHNVVPLLAGRRQEALEEVAAQWSPAAPIALASPRDPSSLQAMARGARVIINAAGPFTDIGEPIVRAAIEAGAHYLDTTGEQHFMVRCRTEFHQRAAQRGLAVLNATAFEYAPGVLAVALFLREAGSVDILDIAYLPGDTRTSRGTKKSILRIAARPALSFEDGHFVPRLPASITREFVLQPQGRRVLAAWFPAGEILVAPRLGRVNTVRTFVAANRLVLQIAQTVAPLLPLGALRPLQALVDRLLEQGSFGPQRAQQRRQSLLFVEASTYNTRYVVSIPSPYDITAAIIVEGAMRLLDSPPQQSGVVSVAEAFDPLHLFEALEQYGITLRREHT